MQSPLPLLMVADRGRREGVHRRTTKGHCCCCCCMARQRLQTVDARGPSLLPAAVAAGIAGDLACCHTSQRRSTAAADSAVGAGNCAFLFTAE